MIGRNRTLRNDTRDSRYEALFAHRKIFFSDLAYADLPRSRQAEFNRLFDQLRDDAAPSFTIRRKFDELKKRWAEQDARDAIGDAHSTEVRSG